MDLNHSTIIVHSRIQLDELDELVLIKTLPKLLNTPGVWSNRRNE